MAVVIQVSEQLAPSGVRFEASMPNGAEAFETMTAADWERVGEVEFALNVENWAATREPLAAAMDAALAPDMPYWLGGFPDVAAAATVDPSRLATLATIFDAWAVVSEREDQRSAGGETVPAAGAGFGFGLQMTQFARWS